MTIVEIAKEAGMHRVSVARLARQGKIPGLERAANGRFKVFDRETVFQWVGAASKKQRHRFRGVQSEPVEVGLKRIRRALAFEKDPSRGPAHEATIHRYEEQERALQSGAVAQVKTCSTADIARTLGVTPQTVRNRARNNRIPGVTKTGRSFRFDQAKAEAYSADKSHHTKLAPSRRISNAIERLERAVTALEEFSEGEGLKGYHPSIQRIANKLNSISNGSILAVGRFEQ
jgi:ribosomal protein S14